MSILQIPSVSNLTPKGPRCLFGVYKFFGQVLVTRDFHAFVPNFDRSCGRGISFMPTKFQDIREYESKVMAKYVVYFSTQAVQADLKKLLFSKIKI